MSRPAFVMLFVAASLIWPGVAYPFPTPFAFLKTQSTSVASHMIFVTSAAQTNGGFGGLAAANAACTTAAGSLTSGGGWKAVLSVPGVAASSNIAVVAPIYNTRSPADLVATDATALWSGTLANPIRYDESNVMTTTDVWTGSTSAGAINAANCTGFTVGTSGVTGETGGSADTSSNWIAKQVRNCDQASYHLYCINGQPQPDMPGSVSLTPQTGAIQVSWTDHATTETGYEVQMSLNQSSWTTIATTAANATQTTNSGLSIGTTYYYRVRALGSSANSSYSPVVSAHTLAFRAFITAAAFNGNLGGTAGANTKCTTAASNAGLAETNWRAVISTNTVSALSNVVMTGNLYNTKTSAPQLIATSNADLWDGEIPYLIEFTETGGSISDGNYVWTGTDTGGTANAFYRCSEWTSSAASGHYGNQGSGTLGQWVSWGNTSCANTYHLYCIGW